MHQNSRPHNEILISAEESRRPLHALYDPIAGSVFVTGLVHFETRLLIFKLISIGLFYALGEISLATTIRDEVDIHTVTKFD